LRPLAANRTRSVELAIDGRQEKSIPLTMVKM